MLEYLTYDLKNIKQEVYSVAESEFRDKCDRIAKSFHMLSNEEVNLITKLSDRC